MCIVCVEFIKGTLNFDEAYNALKELSTEQLEDIHTDHEVADMAYDHLLIKENYEKNI